MELDWVADFPEDTREAIRRLADWHETLSDVVRWTLASKPQRTIEAIIPQDEFTHDVVIAYARDVYLVYDATWLGAVTAVAVWNHEPTANELLDRRLSRGWQPTPTATRSGPQVLGFASCLTPRAA